ncbi:MAG: 5-dehydro-2-deoxygluconokinase [Roseiarcus sp.]
MTDAVTVQKTLDVISIGRSSVDLYGQQIGSRLEDVGSFAKSVGGCAANIAIGTARLGLKSALITRVGAEQMGGFIREQLVREGVAIDGVRVDKQRLTGLVLLAVQAQGASPTVFYRSDCADMALDKGDIEEALVARSRAIVVTGTHFSKPNAADAQMKAIAFAKKHGGKVAFDVDYRPNLWGLAGHEAGFARYVKSEAVSARLKPVLVECDLIVGTEEEIMIAGGADGVLESLKAVRAISGATIVLKRGARGCVVYAGPISDNLEDGIVGKGCPIEVFNVLGAGDAFMSGFLRGWLRGEDLATCATWANACGAFAVSRLLCSPEYPTWPELRHFLDNGSPHRALRMDATLNHLHWATTRRRQIPLLMAFAIDHRIQLEELAGDKAAAARIPAFKVLAVCAAQRVANGRPGFGMLLDDKYGRDALFAAGAGQELWVARPIELPGSCPLQFEFSQDLGSRLIEWPVDHCVKVLCFYHPDDDDALKAIQTAKLVAAFDAARKVGREILIEIIASKNGPLGDDTVSRALAELYDAGLRPDWWKLEPQASVKAWEAIDQVIATRDPLCRGVLLLGLEAPIETLKESFAAARAAKRVRGFAVGRTIFAEAAERWLKGEIGDEAAIDDMAGKFGALVDLWLSVDQR